MKDRQISLRTLDIGSFITDQSSLEGQTSVAEFERLASGLAPGFDLAEVGPVRWTAHGRVAAERGGASQMWLDLSVQAALPWECQRCLKPVIIAVEIEHSIRFVAGEDTAAQLDAESEDDVLALSRQIDLLGLLEDELIMEQPIVPRHDTCPSDMSPLMQSPAVAPDGSVVDEAAEAALESERPNPFAVLSSLKKGQ